MTLPIPFSLWMVPVLILIVWIIHFVTYKPRDWDITPMLILLGYGVAFIVSLVMLALSLVAQ